MPDITVTETGPNVTVGDATTPVVTVSAQGVPGVPGAAGPAGAPGVVQSVNGHSAASVTLTAADVAAVPTAGGTMTGPLVLSADPITGLGAATKQYVDTHSGAAVSSVNGHVGTVVLGAADVSALAVANNLSDLNNAATARTNLGLGGAATENVGTSAGTVAAGNDSRITGALQAANNLSDVAVAATARTNLGLGNSATRNVGTTAGTVAAGDDSRITGAIQPGNAATTVAAATSYGLSSAVGVDTTYAREDHTHGTPALTSLAPATTEGIGQTAAVGTATAPARADHVHPLAAAGTPGSSAVGDAAATGVATTFAASDHVHGRESFGTPGASAVGDTTTAGTAVTPARSDHRHGRETFGTPGSSAVGDAVAAGVAVTPARSDHVHGREAFGVAPAVTESIGTAAAAGTATTPARSDHVHPMAAAGLPGSSAVGDTAATGTATTPAASDHRHAREAFGAVTALSAFGTASANGTAATVSHSDHVHGAPALPAATTSAAGIVQLDGVSGDIAALGTAAAGSVGKAADAGHVHPTTDVVLTSQLPLAVASGGTGASPTAAGTAPTSSGSGAASWQGTPGPVYNVLAYGADATGATDSTSAIQSAINAAQSSAGIVYFPAGTFTVFGIPQITGSNIVVRGAGSATTIKLGSAAQNSSGTVIGLWVNGGSNITIEALGFDGNFASIAKDGGVVVASTLFGSSALAAAVVTAPATGTTETWTVNAAAATATSGYSGIPVVFKTDSEQVLLISGQGTTSWQVRRGFESTTPATHSNGAAITNTEGTLFDATISKYGTNHPKVYKSSQYAGGVDASTYLKQRMPVRITNSTNVTVRGCLVQNSASAGVLVDATSVNGCTDVLVTNNRIKSTWDNGIYFHQGVQYSAASVNNISDTMYNGVSAVYCDHISVVGNPSIRNAGPSFSDSGGVQINGSSNCIVVDNTIDNCQFYGVDALSTQETNITGGAAGNQVWSSNTTIENNTITNCRAADYPTHNAPGINLFGSAGANVNGNSINGCDYGISLGSKATQTAVTYNRVVSCANLGINIGNSADVVGTVVKGNYVAYNGSNGIYANAAARYEHNTIIGNGSMGINLSSPPTGVPSKVDWIVGNTITDNADSGVYANAGTGNVAIIERNVFGNSPAVIFNDASITFNTAAFTSQSANFTSADVGLPLVFMDQGGSGVTTATTIASVTNSTTASAASPPQATETGVSFWIGRGPATFTDASTTNAANSVVTSATAAFTSSDAGKLAVLMTQTLTPQIVFAGTIQSVTNSTTATLSGAAGAGSNLTLIINRSAGQQIRAINNGSGTVIDRNNSVWGIPEILTGGNTYSVQTQDRLAVRDTSPTLDRTARYVGYTTLTAARTVTLPDATVCMGQTVVIADETGNASSTNTITVNTQSAQTIDGASTAVIRVAYGTLNLYSNGANWFLRQTLLAATDGSIVVTGNGASPTLATGTVDAIAAAHPAAADWSNNGHKITSLANGTASSDAAAFGQIPTALPPNGTAGGDLTGSYPNPTVAKVNGGLLSAYSCTDQGLLAETYDVALAGASGATLNSGTLYLARLRLGAASTITNLICLVGAAGSGVTAAYLGLYNSSGTLVASTADRHADAIWTAGSGVETAPLSSTYSAAAGLYWVGLLLTFSTTSPSIGRQSVISGGTVNVGLAAGSGNLRFAIYTTTGLSTLPGSFTPTSQMAGDNHAFWFGMS